MSVWLMGRVWQCDLPRPQQWVLMALADHADDEGFNVRPSVPLVAWKTSYSDRQVQRIIDQLEELGILVVVQEATPRRPTEYQIVLSAAAKKQPFRSADAPETRGDILSPLPQVGDDTDVTPEVTQLRRPRGDIAMSPEPSIEPSENQEKRTKRKSAEERWTSTLVELRGQVTGPTFDRYLSQLELVERRGDELVLQAPDDVAAWVRERFVEMLEGTAARHFGPAVTVKVAKSETELARERQEALGQRRPPRRRRPAA